MLHDKNTISQHFEHSLPFFLLDFAVVEKTETIAQIELIHSDEACREYDGSWDVHIKVIAYALEPVFQKYQGNVNQKAEAVNEDDAIPLHGRREAAKQHHQEPGSKRLVEVEAIIILQNCLLCGENAYYGYAANVKVVLHETCLLVYLVQYANEGEYYKWKDKV